MEDNVKGLKNTGNMCFINVVIQALFNLVSVKQFLSTTKSHHHEIYDEEALEKILEFQENIAEDIQYNEDSNYLSMIISERMKKKDKKMVKKISLNLKNKGKKQFSDYEEGVQVVSTMNDGCLFCLLQNFFYNYIFSNNDSLNLEYIRGFLMTLNNDIMKFNLTGMCCSVETLEEMLLYFHRFNIFPHYYGNQRKFISEYKGRARIKLEEKIDSIKCKEKCLCHSLFTFKYKEVVKCTECDTLADMIENVSINFKKSEVENNIFYFYINDLLDIEKEHSHLEKNATFKDLFIRLPFRNLGKLRSLECYNCKKNENLRLTRIACDPSKVIVLNLLPPPGDTSKIIEKVYLRINSEIRISDIFEFKNKFSNKEYTVRGMICFKGLHYIYVGFYISINCWYILNDEKCNHYQSWKKLRDYLIKNNWFPVLIFYEDNQFLNSNQFDIIEDPFNKEAPKECLIF